MQLDEFSRIRLLGIIKYADSTGDVDGENSKVSLCVEIYDPIKKKRNDVEISLEDFEERKFEKFLRKNGVMVEGAYKIIKESFLQKVRHESLPTYEVRYTNLGFDKKFKKFVGAKIIGTEIQNAVYVGNLAVCCEGSFENLVRLFDDEISNNPNMQAIMGIAALATILPYAQKIWKVRSNTIMVHLCGDSSSGKTTAAELVSSFGGNPDSNCSNSLMFNFVDTQLALIRKIGNNYGIPISVDEFTAIKRTECWDAFIYNVCNGTEKDRMGAGGHKIMVGNRYHTVILTTGERTISTYLKEDNKGSAVRLFEIAREQFTLSKENSDKIKEGVESNFGMLSPMIADEIIRNSQTWLERYDCWLSKTESKLSETDCEIAIVKRIMPYVAMAMVGIEILEDIFERKFDKSYIVDFYIRHFIYTTLEKVDVSTKTYQAVEDFIAEKGKKITSNFSRDFDDNICTSDDSEECVGVVIYLAENKRINNKEYNVKYVVFKETLDEYLRNVAHLDPYLSMCALQDAGLVMGKTSGKKQKQLPYKTGCVINQIRHKVYEVYGTRYVPNMEYMDESDYSPDDK